MGLYLEKSMIASKTHLIYTLKLKREELCAKKEEKMKVVKYACSHDVTNESGFSKKSSLI